MIDIIKNRFRNSALLKDSSWSLIGNIVGKGFSLIAGIVVARCLGKEVYGEYGIIKSTLLMIALFSSFGLGISATKFIAEAKENCPSKLRSIELSCNIITLIVSGIIAILVFFFAERIAMLIEAPHLNNILRWSAFAIVLNAINTTQIGVLGGFKAYKITARNNIIAGIATFLATIPLTVIYGFIGAIIALLFSLAINCLINRISIRKMLPKEEEKIDRQQLKTIITFSLPVALQESSYSITSWLASFVIIKYSNYGELGICSAATQWAAVLAFVPGALRNVALSHFSSVNNNVDRSKVILKRLLQINFLSTMLPCMLIWIFSGIICSFYGENFVGLQGVLNIMAFGAVINSLSNILTQELIALNRNWFLFFTRFVRDFGVVVCTGIILHLFVGGAIEYACVLLIFNVFYLFILIYKYYNIQRNFITKSK